MTTPTLRGPRVVLRAVRPEDEQARLSLGWHAAIECNYGREVQTRGMTPAEARAWYEQQQTRAADPSRRHWIIQAEGHLVGVTGLHELKTADRKAHFVIGLFTPGHARHGRPSHRVPPFRSDVVFSGTRTVGQDLDASTPGATESRASMKRDSAPSSGLGR